MSDGEAAASITAPARPATRDRGGGGIRALVREAVLIGGAYLAFNLVQDRLGTDDGAALANAARIRELEAALGIGIEPAANTWLSGHARLSWIAALVYAAALALPAVVLAWTFWRHPRRYPALRWLLVGFTACSLLAFLAFPVSPPRFAILGVSDVVGTTVLVRDADAATGRVIDLNAAMPSLHVAWSCWCAFAAVEALAGRLPRARFLAWGYAVLVAVDVVATGNHYVLDVLAGAALALVPALAVHRWWGAGIRPRRGGADA